MSIRKTNSQFLLFFFIGVCLLLFYTYCQIPVKSWDEAVYANNAIEMSKSHNWWVMYANGVPDFYNTKPPFVIWLQSIFISVFGVNEVSVRLPSFLSLLIIIIFIFQYLRKKTEVPYLPFFSCSVLLTSAGFLGFHAVATGDLDATLCLWTTLASLIFFDKIILSNEPPKAKWIYLICGLLFLGFLTKSTAIFLCFPGLLLAVLFFKKQSILLKKKHFYFGLLTVILLIISYYFLMEAKRPGYFNYAWNSEYKRIYSNIMPWHNHSFVYYFSNLNSRFFPWCWLLIPAIISGVLSKNYTTRGLTIFSLLFCVCYLLIISIPVVKLEWYDVPLYPFLAILTGVFFSEMLIRAKSYFANNKTLEFVFFFLFFALSVVLFVRTLDSVKHPAYHEPLEEEGTAVNKLLKTSPEYRFKILMEAGSPEHYNQVNFYREKFFRTTFFKPEIISAIKNVAVNDTILVYQQSKLDSLKIFQVDTLKRLGGSLLIRIVGLNNSQDSNNTFNN